MTKKSLVKNSNFALLYGVLLGDGCISKVGKHNYFISIVGHIKDDFDFLSNVVKPSLLKFTSNKVEIKKRVKERKAEINFTDKKLFYQINEIGFPVGKKGDKLSILEAFDLNLYKYIVQGYFSTDGCLVLANNNGIIYPRIEFCSISKRLLSQVLSYLTDLGMNGSLYLKKKYPDKNWFTQYRLQFNGQKNLELFRDKVGFVNIKHQHKYDKYKNAAGGI